MRYPADAPTVEEIVTVMRRAGDTNNRCDTFVRDAASGVTTRVSVTASGGESRLHLSSYMAITQP